MVIILRNLFSLYQSTHVYRTLFKFERRFQKNINEYETCMLEFQITQTYSCKIRGAIIELLRKNDDRQQSTKKKQRLNNTNPPKTGVISGDPER